jgi:hypothetical protein
MNDVNYEQTIYGTGITFSAPEKKYVISPKKSLLFNRANKNNVVPSN